MTTIKIKSLINHFIIINTDTEKTAEEIQGKIIEVLINTIKSFEEDTRNDRSALNTNNTTKSNLES